MSAPTPGWRELPECPGCERPMARRTARRNGGYCSTCRPITAEHPAVAGERIQLAEWTATVARIGRERRAAEEARAARRRERRERR